MKRGLKDTIWSRHKTEIFITEGGCERILTELWELHEKHPKKDYPIFVEIAGYVVKLETKRDLFHFYLGLQTGIEMNMI